MQVGRHAGREGGEIGAHGGVGLHPQPGDAALAVEGHLGVGHVIAAVGVGEAGLGAGGRPLDRPLEAHRAPGGDRLVGVVVDLAAEAAAHLGRDHPDLVLGQVDRGQRHQQPVDVGVLRGHPQGERAATRVEIGQRGPRLDGGGQDAVIAQVDRHPLGGGVEGGVGLLLVAERPVEGHVAGGVLVDLGRTLVGRPLGVDRCRQRLVLHLDQLGGVGGGVAALGHHHRHSVADVAHGVDGEDRMGWGLQVGQQPSHRDHAAGLALLDVLAGEDRHHPRRGRRLVGFDPGDAGVGVRAAHDDRVQHAGQDQVVGVLAAAGDQSGVFPALDRGSEHAHLRHLPGPRSAPP